MIINALAFRTIHLHTLEIVTHGLDDLFSIKFEEKVEKGIKAKVGTNFVSSLIKWVMANGAVETQFHLRFFFIVYIQCTAAMINEGRMQYTKKQSACWKSKKWSE